MSLKSFQIALAELIMSPALRRRAQEDPEGALAGFDLTARERRRLLAVAADARTRAGTRIHRAFRLSMLARTLPKTCVVLGPERLRDVVHAFWRRHLPESLYYSREAARFGEELRRRLASGELDDDPLLADVLEVELAILSLADEGRRGRLGGGGPEDELPAGGEATSPAGGDRPAPLPPECRLLRLRHDPERFLPALEREEVPRDLVPGEHWLLLTWRGGGRIERRALPAAAGRRLAADEEPAVPPAIRPTR